MPIMEIHDISIARYPSATKVKGRYTKGTPSTITGKAHIQPLDFVELGGLTVEIEMQGDNVREYAKMYSYIEVQKNDIITDVTTGDIYRVMKVYPYYRAGLSIDHYKVIMVMEDAS